MELEIRVTREDGGVEVKYFVDGKCYTGYMVGRVLTNTTNEEKNGLFEPRLCQVGFYRGDIKAVVDFSDAPLPARPDENAPEQEWREWAMDVAGVVRKRATLVRKAFRPPFNLSVIAEI